MRLLFNATNIRSEGGVILMRHLLEGFLAFSEDLRVLLYLNPELVPRLAEWLESQTRVELVPFRPQGSFGRFRWEQLTLPKIIREERVDTLFSFGNTGPLRPGCRQILYLQQSIPYTRYTPARHRLKWLYFQKLYGFLIGLAQRGSERVVVPTGWLVSPMRRSIGNRKPPEAYQVTLPGIPDLPPLPENTLLPEPEVKLLEQLEHWRAEDVKILVYPCYLAPYKNIPYLLEAIQALQEKQPPAFRLLLTFDAGSREYFPCRKQVFEALEALNSENVILTGSLSRHAMAEVYRRADMLVFPSLVETLGLPLLEAMSHGIPVVAAQSEDNASTVAAFAREICGEGALYAAPDDPAEFAERLHALLSDPQLAFETGQRGLARAGALSWPEHVRRILSF